MARGHGLVRFRSPLLAESRLISFPPGTEMFQFPGSARTGLYIQPAVTPSSCEVTPGFPIRTSPDQGLFDGSPELIAAYHVLHRLSTPRHPPCTLNSLIAWLTCCQSEPSQPWRLSDTPHASAKQRRHRQFNSIQNRTSGSVATELARSILIESTANVHPPIRLSKNPPSLARTAEPQRKTRDSVLL